VSNQTKSEVAGVYAEFLRREGYVPDVDEDGDVRFKCEGLTYVVMIDPSDTPFFRLLLPNVWRASDEAERRDALAAVNEVTSTTKVAKFFVGAGGVVSGAAELFTKTPAQATASLRRCLSALQTTLRTFARKMQS
jgi:hypothetical protein